MASYIYTHVFSIQRMLVACIVCVANNISLRLCKVLVGCYDCVLRVRIAFRVIVCALFFCVAFGLGMQFVLRIRCFYKIK